VSLLEHHTWVRDLVTVIMGRNRQGGHAARTRDWRIACKEMGKSHSALRR
jgi:hypothetical protein